MQRSLNRPFARLDTAGVGKFIKIAAELAVPPAPTLNWASAANTAGILPVWNSATIRD